MEVIDLIAHAWGWTGIRPSEVVGQNDFGNLIVRDVDGKYLAGSPVGHETEKEAKEAVEELKKALASATYVNKKAENTKDEAKKVERKKDERKEKDDK